MEGSKKPKCIEELRADDFIQAGLSPEEADSFANALAQVLAAGNHSATEIWREVVARKLLRPDHPHSLHQLIYYTIYSRWDASLQGLPFYWFPSENESRYSNLGRLMQAHGPRLLGKSYKDPITSFSAFSKFSAENPDIIWSILLKEMSVRFHQPPRCILDDTDKSKPGGTWLPGSVLNIAECCLMPSSHPRKTDNSVAVTWRDENCDDSPVCQMTLKELRERVMRAANSIDSTFSKGDLIAIDMPMTVTAVIIYLAIVLTGRSVVAIAESFSAKEIALRLRVSGAKAIFTQDFVLRGGRTFPLYSRVAEATSCTAIVIPADGNAVNISLRKQDISWNDFLARSSHLPRPKYYSPVYVPGDSLLHIMFSSGTTGDPKAIPWTHLSPIGAAGESLAHLDVQVGDVFCWPTSFGWTIGPLLLFSCFLNGATLALYNGSPLGRGFGKFIQDARVSILGCIPTLVRTWKNSCCMDGLDWTSLRLITTSGEASNVDDDLWLSSRIQYKPIIECCGGTELAGGYVMGCVLQPLAFGAMSTSSLSTAFVILDEHGTPYPDDQPCEGEVALLPRIMGSSDRLLNADHDEVYFKGMPVYKGMRLRRHGDFIKRTTCGYYFVQGRADDTMNLGGIKTSSLEIERACSQADEGVLEVAAVSTAPPEGGPEMLIVFAVLKEGAKRDPEKLRMQLSRAIQRNLNPLFKLSMVKIVPEFPRNATNKLLRRVLKDQIKKELSIKSSI